MSAAAVAVASRERTIEGERERESERASGLRKCIAIFVSCRFPFDTTFFAAVAVLAVCVLLPHFLDKTRNGERVLEINTCGKKCILTFENPSHCVFLYVCMCVCVCAFLFVYNRDEKNIY